MKKSASPTECRDTALALAFLGLLIWLFTKNNFWAHLTMALLLLAMIWPRSMKYPAILWFGLSHALGLVVSKIILGLAYFLLVCPVAAVRKMMGKDAMRLKAWKSGQDSVFVVRQKTFSKDDLSKQF